MRIALVASEYVTENTFDGGLANYMHRTAMALRLLGHEPVIIVRSDRDQTFTHDGIAVHRVRVWHGSHWLVTNRWLAFLNAITRHRFIMAINVFWQSLQLNRTVKALHAEKPFDIIHYAHLAAVGLMHPKGIPWVVRISSATLLCQQLGGYGTPDSQIRQQHFLEQWTLRRADAIVGPSTKIAALVGGAVGRPVRVIESPFLLDISASDDSVYRSHLAGKKYLLFFGTIGLIKGVSTIAEMIGPLLASHAGLHFVFVGKVQAAPAGSGGTMMDHVKAMAGDAVDRVIHCPALQHEQLYPIVQNAFAVVLPSRIDNFPNACIEAMYFRRVVIGTKGNGFEQLISDGVSGFLVTVDDAMELLSSTKRVLALSDDERNRIGDRAYARIEQLKPEKVVTQLIDFYGEVIDAKKSGTVLSS